MRSEGVEVEPGYVSTILITPKQELMQDQGIKKYYYRISMS